MKKRLIVNHGRKKCLKMKRTAKSSNAKNTGNQVGQSTVPLSWNNTSTVNTQIIQYIVFFQHQIENDAPSRIKITYEGTNLDVMEEYSKCALGTYYYTGTLAADGTAIYTQSQKEYKACSLGYMEPIILKDWDTNTWIGTVRKFSYMIYCIPYKWIFSLKLLRISMQMVFSQTALSR